LGTLPFTCPNEARTEPVGYVCCLASSGAARIVADGLLFANGLALLDDGRLVVAETFGYRLWIGKWDPASLTVSNGRQWIDFGGSAEPDGMALDRSGTLHVALFGAGLIGRIDRSGRMLQPIPVPGAWPTNCCFDPRDPLRLIVTEAQTGMILEARLPGNA
jgi:gluconolactonase